MSIKKCSLDCQQWNGRSNCFAAFLLKFAEKEAKEAIFCDTAKLGTTLLNVNQLLCSEETQLNGLDTNPALVKSHPSF